MSWVTIILFILLVVSYMCRRALGMTKDNIAKENDLKVRERNLELAQKEIDLKRREDEVRRQLGSRH